MIVSYASPVDFAAILALHAQKHVSQHGENERRDGFLTNFTDLEQLAHLE